MKKKNIIEILIAFCIIGLSYVLYDRLMEPVKFNQEVRRREAIIIEKLKDIRTMEVAYKLVYDNYNGNLDSLADFIKNQKIPIVIKNRNLTDFLIEENGSKKNLVNKEIGFVNVYNALFASKNNYNLNTLKIIPTTLKKFKIKANILTSSSAHIPVFEVTASYDDYLSGLNKQLINMLKLKAKDLKRYGGLKLGSLEEPSIKGNWE